MQLAEKGDLALLENLVRKSPEVLSEKDECGASPLHHAAGGGHVTLIQFISSVVDPQGEQTSVTDHKNSSVRIFNRLKVIIWFKCILNVCLCNLCSELNSCDDHGNVPLHWAVERNKAESCRTLLDLGADPNILNTALLSPLHLAVSLGHNSLVGVSVQVIKQPWSLMAFKVYSSLFPGSVERLWILNILPVADSCLKIPSWRNRDYSSSDWWDNNLLMYGFN